MNKRYAAVKRKVFAALKSKGFRVHGKVACRDTDGNWELVEFFAPNHWRERADELVFSVIVGVELLHLREGSYWGVDQKPSTTTTNITASLSVWVNQDPTDAKGFRLDDFTDIDALSDEIIRGLEQYGLPWMDERRTDDKLINMYQKCEDLGEMSMQTLCVLLWKQGRKEEYGAVKERLLCNRYPQESVDRYVQWFAKLEAQNP